MKKNSKVSLPHIVEKEELTKPPPAKPAVASDAETTKHEINLAVLTIVVGGLAWFMFR